MGLRQRCTKPISVRAGLRTSSLPVKMNEFALAAAHRKCIKWDRLLLFSLYSAALSAVSLWQALKQTGQSHVISYSAQCQST